MEWFLLAVLAVVVTVDRWQCREALVLAKTFRDQSNYYRAAYELLVKQTGRDLNDGYGVDPRKADAAETQNPPASC